jgi:glycosyltransferase involved in cell wall biosynthesis
MIPTELISVIIPCYNDGAYLHEAIASIRKQYYPAYEIIVVNDGSTDPATLKVLDDVVAPDVQVLHKENGRMASARNYGIKHARGRIIAALDSDDYFGEGFFNKAMAILNTRQEIGVVTSYIQLFGAENKVGKPRGGTSVNFLFGNQCPACAIYRIECWEQIGGFDETMKMGYEDWEFYIRVTRQGWEIEVIPERLLFYRRTVKSTYTNDTTPHKVALVNYIVDKHQDWYLDMLKQLIVRQEILYTESRISYQRIFKMLKNRLLGKYK